MSRFDEVWPTLERRVRAVLANRGVRGEELDDLTQETALRLFRAWPTLDPDRPAAAYATTVALNAWRDGLKRASTTRELLSGTVPEQSDSVDVERTVLARLEVARVSAAMRLLRQRDRDALMAEESGPAHRMARMRARRELLAAMERASVAFGILLGLRRLLRPRVSGLAVSAGALTLASMVAIGSAPSAPAHIEGAPQVAAPRLVSAPVAVTKARPVAHHVAAPIARVHHKAAPKKPAVSCSEEPSAPPPAEDNGLPIGAQILGDDAIVDVELKPTGTRVRSQNDGCTQVVTGR
ncbi:MAG: Sigma-70 region 2 [Frankiaceae bacterium]|jgi:RNA polymerase sigma-70 factor (ECF subfamily)|nr:Sigma-70 region 2 [Frankiaceae bacterium]MDX6273563.1 Sigma-70 region 2 [Frankiales bacterium]